jgi:tetratricopeptide (TPR) repeat protein
MFNYYGLSHVRLAWTLAELGEFAEGLAYGEETAEICQARANWWGVAHSLSAIGLVHLHRGALHAAIPVLEQGISLCRLRDFPAVIPDAAARLGHAYALAGRPVEGLMLLEQSLRDAERFKATWPQSLRSVWLAEALLLAGRIDDAAATVQRAFDLAVQRKEKAQQAYARRLFGEIASHDTHCDVAAAEHHYRLAASLAEELGMRPLLAHCHFGLGKLYRAVGKQQAAREHLMSATTMYREMDMRFWPEQAIVLASS